MTSQPQFISEPIVPTPGSADLTAMSRGEPGLPRSFTWRDQRFEVANVHKTWKTTRTDRGDTYIYKHWFDVETTDGKRMTLYCMRQIARGGKNQPRWWLYTILS
jgi:Family of unknown function (DUF6504)